MSTKSTNPRSQCPIANSLDILGDRWSMLIIRDILFAGKTEYGELINSPEGISTNILAERLGRLRDVGILNKSMHSHNKKKFVYSLTEKGMDLVPVIVELILWGEKHAPNSAVPSSVLKSMKKDKQGFIKSLRKNWQKSR